MQTASAQQPTATVAIQVVTATTFRNLATVLTSKHTTPQREATGLRTARLMEIQLKFKEIPTGIAGIRPFRHCPA